MYQNSILRDHALNPIWQEEDGRAVIDITSVPIKEGHTRELSFKGIWNEWVAADGRYRWGGPDLLWNPGSGILRYRFHLRQTGRYLIALRSTGGDCFVRVDGGQWWRATCSDGWGTLREAAPGRAEPYAEDFDAGFHQIEISGRSGGFAMDRLSIAREGLPPDGPVSQQRPR